MTTYVFTPAAPPSLALVTTGAGTLTNVTCPLPAGTLARPPYTSLRVSFYDLSVATPLAIAGAVPIATIGGNGFANYVFDAAFENGLVALVNSTSTVEVTYS